MHACTALNKQYVQHMTASLYQDPTLAWPRALLGLLSVAASDSIASCRPLARMAVVLVGDLLPGLISALLELHDAARVGGHPHLAHIEMLCREAGVVFDNCVRLLLSSIDHPERPLGSLTALNQALQHHQQHHVLDRVADTTLTPGWFLPFRVKQDHIGAVGFLKVAPLMGKMEAFKNYFAGRGGEGGGGGGDSAATGGMSCVQGLCASVSVLQQLQLSGTWVTGRSELRDALTRVCAGDLKSISFGVYWHAQISHAR